MSTGNIYSLTAFILKRKNTGEKDKLLTVFSLEHGKVRLLAKGVRKVGSRRSPYLGIFSHVRLIVHRGKSLDTVTDVSPKRLYEDQLTSLERIGSAYVVSECIDKLLPDNEKHEEIFRLFSKTLERFCTVGESDVKNELVIFFREFLIATGYLSAKSPIKNFSDYIFMIEEAAERKLKTVKLLQQIS